MNKIKYNSLALAAEYHKYQQYGLKPYLYHLLDVWFEAERFCNQNNIKGIEMDIILSVCALHDILEDTTLYESKLKQISNPGKDLDHTLEKAPSLLKESPKSKPGTMSMMGKPSRQLPPEYASKDLSMAILKGSGEWKKGDNAFKVITTPDGTIRLQVRDSVGKVIDERYLK